MLPHRHPDRTWRYNHCRTYRCSLAGRSLLCLHCGVKRTRHLGEKFEVIWCSVAGNDSEHCAKVWHGAVHCDKDIARALAAAWHGKSLSSVLCCPVALFFLLKTAVLFSITVRHTRRGNSSYQESLKVLCTWWTCPLEVCLTVIWSPSNDKVSASSLHDWLASLLQKSAPELCRATLESNMYRQ